MHRRFRCRMLASSKSVRERPMSEHAARVRERQDPLRKRYREAPEEACITDHAVASSAGVDPFHGKVAAGGGAPFAYGIHRAVGGDHDLPNPGDLLCAALAACLDSSLRLIAARMAVKLETLEVAATAFADVRGCLMVDSSVPAGFQRIEVDVRLGARQGHRSRPCGGAHRHRREVLCRPANAARRRFRHHEIQRAGTRRRCWVTGAASRTGNVRKETFGAVKASSNLRRLNTGNGRY